MRPGYPTVQWFAPGVHRGCPAVPQRGSRGGTDHEDPSCPDGNCLPGLRADRRNKPVTRRLPEGDGPPACAPRAKTAAHPAQSLADKAYSSPRRHPRTPAATRHPYSSFRSRPIGGPRLLRRASRGARPPRLDREVYKRRNTVEAMRQPPRGSGAEHRHPLRQDRHQATWLDSTSQAYSSGPPDALHETARPTPLDQPGRRAAQNDAPGPAISARGVCCCWCQMAPAAPASYSSLSELARAGSRPRAAEQ